MSNPTQDRFYTVEEYFALEASSQEKYEYVNGRVIAIREMLAMAGGAINHALIAANILVALSNRLKGGSCRAFGSDLRVRIPRKTLYFYPDVTVVCGPGDVEDNQSAGQTVTNPKLIVEVLSPGSELYDRGKKFARYLEMPSLEEYVLVSQQSPRVESHLRQDDGSWSFTFASGTDATIKLRSLDIKLPLIDIYSGVDLPAEECD